MQQSLYFFKYRKYIFYSKHTYFYKFNSIKVFLKRFCNTTINMDDYISMEVDNSNNFFIDKNACTPVSEGLANVNFPSSHDVFYNPVQEFNRDMSIAVLRLHASDYKIIQEEKVSQNKKPIIYEYPYIKMKEEDFSLVSSNTSILPCGEKDDNGIRVLEALAASGLRSIRYAKEVGGIREIIANDISKQAVECMKANLERNNVDNIVKANLNDASLVMYQNRGLNKRFSAIDLDPYGSPHTFLDGAVQSVVDGGLLLVTCTDMAVLCGNSPETCYTKYGSLSMKHKACHEMSLRIILQCIEANANKYGRYIVPLLSMSVDFYARVFVRIFTSQLKCKETFTKLSWVTKCTTCESTHFQPLGNIIRNGNSVRYQLSPLSIGPICAHCGGTHRTGGPIWTAPMHDRNFVLRLKASLTKGTPFNTLRRMEGILSLIEEELPDVPLYIVYDKILNVLRMPCFKIKKFASAILNAGYRVSPTHAARNGLKTDAPFSVLWEILRAREKLFPINKDKLPANHAARYILKCEDRHNKSDLPNDKNSQSSTLKVSFEIHPDSTFESEKSKVLRYQINPRQNWGPKARAVTSIFHGDLEEKSKKKQGFKKKFKKLKREKEEAANGMLKEKKENEEPF